MQTDTALDTVNPATGELLDLRALTTDQLAELSLDVGDYRDRIQRFRDEVVAELAGRMDRELKRTAQIGDYRLTVNAPTRDEWDIVRLSNTLTALRDQGVLGDVADEVIYTPDPKPMPATVRRVEVNKLLKHPDPTVVEQIRSCCEPVPQRRTLKVESAVERAAK